MKLLLEHGADINIAGNGRITVLQIARNQKNTKIVELLLAHGANE